MRSMLYFPKFTVPWRFISYNMRGLIEISAMQLHPSFFFVPVDNKKRAKELWTCTEYLFDIAILV